MLHLPIRSNLVAQTVTILTAEIEAGRIHGELPGEYTLCESLQISRTTLRAALKIMERQGYLQARRGLPRLVMKGRRTPVPSADKRPVWLLAARPQSRHTRHTYEVISQVLISLQRLGHECKYVADPKFADGSPQHALERLMLEAPNAIWLLLSCSAETQAWFYKRGLTTFVLGHLHPGVRLPACDVDSQSVGRHAAVQLLNRGHRHVALISPDPFSAGDLSAEVGFAEALEKAGIARDQITTLKVKWRREEILRLVKGLLMRREPPTALLVLHEETAVCIYSALIRRGVRVPEDMSLIVGDGGELLDRFTPDFSHYRMDLRTEGKRTCHIIGNFVSNGALHSSTHLLMPDFHRGETIADRRRSDLPTAAS